MIESEIVLPPAETQSTHAGRIASLRDGALVSFSNPVPIDERLSWYPDHVRGFTCVNAFLLTEGAYGLLIDTGVRAHRDELLAQIRSSLGPVRSLSIAHTMIGEYTSCGNTAAFAEQLSAERLYASLSHPELWVEFRPPSERNAEAEPMSQGVVVRSGDTIDVDPEGRRFVSLFTPALRLLPTHWFYDSATRTLFTGDSFSHVRRLDAAGPWVLDDDATGSQFGGTSLEEVREQLLVRCWWLTQAHHVDRLRRGLAAAFETSPVETIAPRYGCIIHGARNVRTHYEMMQAALRSFEHP